MSGLRKKKVTGRRAVAAADVPVLRTTQQYDEATAKALAYEQSARSSATRRAYRSDWAIFISWCKTVKARALPASAQTICAFLTDEVDSGRAIGTIERRLAAIGARHDESGASSQHRHVKVRTCMSGIRRAGARSRSRRGTNKKRAALGDDVMNMVDSLDLDTLAGLRDRVVLLLGFAGGFRRSELVAIDVEDIEFGRLRMSVTIWHAKGDQGGETAVQTILAEPDSPYCPVRAVRAWMKAASVSTGPLLRRVWTGGRIGPDALSDQTVAAVVKRCAVAAGLPGADYAGHSLRRGLATSAIQGRTGTLDEVMRTLRHKNVQTTLEYVEEDEKRRGKPSQGLLTRGRRGDA